MALIRLGYRLQWTQTGPAAQWRPPVVQRRAARRAAASMWETIHNRQRLQKFRTQANRRPLPSRPSVKVIPLSTSGSRPPFREPIEEISAFESQRLKAEELENWLGASKSAEIGRASEELGLSRPTLHRLLHGTQEHLSWRTARLLRQTLPARDWAQLQFLLWPRGRRPAYKRRLGA